MPLPVAPLVGWLLGVWLAWAAREDRPADDRPLLLSRPLLVSVALAAFVFGPVVGYFNAFHGDWSYLYVVAWHRVPSAIDLVLVLLASATLPFGLAAGRAAARVGRSGLLVRCASGPAAALICPRRTASFFLGTARQQNDPRGD